MGDHSFLGIPGSLVGWMSGLLGWVGSSDSVTGESVRCCRCRKPGEGRGGGLLS